MAESALKKPSLKNISYVRIHRKNRPPSAAAIFNDKNLRQSIREGRIQGMFTTKSIYHWRRPWVFESWQEWPKREWWVVFGATRMKFICYCWNTGLIISLDCLIFWKTMQLWQRLLELGYTLPVAFNASSFDLLHQTIFYLCVRMHQKIRFVSCLLELEVTETSHNALRAKDFSTTFLLL